MATLSELKIQADSLPPCDLEDLLSYLVLSLGSPVVSADDDEVETREREMDSGEVELVTHDEFSSIVRSGAS